MIIMNIYVVNFINLCFVRKNGKIEHYIDEPMNTSLSWMYN